MSEIPGPSDGENSVPNGETSRRNFRIVELSSLIKKTRRGDYTLFRYGLTELGQPLEKEVVMRLAGYTPELRTLSDSLEGILSERRFVALSNAELATKNATTFILPGYFHQRGFFDHYPSEADLRVIYIYEFSSKKEIHAVDVSQVHLQGDKYKTTGEPDEQTIAMLGFADCSDQDAYSNFMRGKGYEVVEEGKNYRIIKTSSGLFRVRFEF